MKALTLILLASTLCLGCEAKHTDPAGGESPTSGAGQAAGGQQQIPPTQAPLFPGRGTLQRLNRTEYNNTLRDLLGTSQRPGDNLPAEDISAGFDNVSEALNVSSLHVETYYDAAERLIDEALAAGAPRREQILVCDVALGGHDCARSIIRTFARRTFRRPPSEAQVERLMAFMAVAAAQGDPPLVGVKLALRAALVSARFLFRVELNPEVLPTMPWKVDDFELASRLSYFLWSSLPDEALLQKAEAGLLGNEALSEQATRMVGDARSAALTSNFAGQWLQFRAVPRHQPDLVVFPEFSSELAQSMVGSTERFFHELLSTRLPLARLVTAETVPVDLRLAALYGVPGVADESWRSVATPPGRGAGVLGHASVLMVTSERGRTSPVKRGAWVLSNLLCSPPPPPPPGVEGLDEGPSNEATLTVRERLKQHQTAPACAACHATMDPIGFGLENFDAIGRWRTEEHGKPLDTLGILPDGTSFSTAEQLGRIVASDPRFLRCVAQKLSTYALGRVIDEARDTNLITEMVDQASAADASLLSMALALVKSPYFLERSPEPLGAP